ncbi:MEKHLA domain-containing protein [Oceanospirillum beijerinckii]|uniref:MEKHLA domain-containing protein n=1 Tax=Oceanospirillum beijerinckii TaxID=64976 RepID=UPI000427E903|nr:MEKHLA domain-containing protein [Oceanospirillum beijerinckii]MAC46095.1 MEKHLA domain-containing protein [Oceanospirillum sp.]
MSLIPEALTTPFYQRHGQLLCYSFQKLLGRPLLNDHDLSESDPELIQKLYNAPFALLSHGLEADPIFNFGNQRALELFEFSWLGFIQLPSRHSAEPINREERAALLKKVTDQGYIDDYSGIRISSTGQRFIIEQAIVWNIIDELGQFHGQAAMFEHIRPL